MSLDRAALADAVARQGAVVRVLVARVAGSAPRGPGTSMLVWAGGQEGTIGGGALEHGAVLQARDLLAAGTTGHAEARTLPLGPALGQCCGGSVTLVTEMFTAANLPLACPHARPLRGAGPMPAPLARRLAALPARFEPILSDGWLIEAETAPARPLWIFGAGHVGRALVSVLAPFPEFAMTWVDTGAERFALAIPARVSPLVCADPVRAVPLAPRDADHLILTYSHAMDLALCDALLRHGFASAGLIGSASKWARFRGRLAALGHGPAEIARIACPIGEPDLGRDPQAIAIGVAVALLRADAGRAAQSRHKDQAG